MKDINDDSLKQIAESVQYYLSYFNTVTNLSRQIEESTIRYPVSEYVERKMEVSEAEFEHSMEGFPSKRTDFIFKISKDKRFAFEFKYVKAPTETHKRINYLLDFKLYFNDLVRLAYLNKEHHYRSFFLVAGESKNFSTFFQRDGMNTPELNKIEKEKENDRSLKGRFSDNLLSFDTSGEGENPIRSFDASKLYYIKGNPREIYKDENNPTVNKKDRVFFYEEFCNKYNNDKIVFPPDYYGIDTTLITLLNAPADKQSVGLWEVKYRN